MLFLAYDKERASYYEVVDYLVIYPIEMIQTRIKAHRELQENELSHLYSNTEHWNLIPMLKEVQDGYNQP